MYSLVTFKMQLFLECFSQKQGHNSTAWLCASVFWLVSNGFLFFFFFFSFRPMWPCSCGSVMSKSSVLFHRIVISRSHSWLVRGRRDRIYAKVFASFHEVLLKHEVLTNPFYFSKSKKEGIYVYVCLIHFAIQ